MTTELITTVDALPIENPLSSSAARVPAGIEQCSGIVLQGKRLHSFAYSTDVAVIRNTNADAILAVYPFTGQPVITQSLLTVAQAPLFVGVGGGTTTGRRVIELAIVADMQGAAGVVLNSPAPVATVRDVAMTVNIPVVATVTAWDRQVEKKIEAGAAIINVAAGRDTPQVVEEIKKRYPEVPVLASGGGTEGSIERTIRAGANALSWTPPDAQTLQHAMMERYREEKTTVNLDSQHAGATQSGHDPQNHAGKRKHKRQRFSVKSDDEVGSLEQAA